MGRKLLLLPLLLAFACLLAGAFGASHNQVSYTLGPDYFHALKFQQFAISDTLPARIGAALVGWYASWWMGLVIGLPVALLALFMPDARGMAGLFLRLCLLVVGLTALMGALSLAAGVPEGLRELIRIPPGVGDTPGFLRAAFLHEVSYGGGLIALILALIFGAMAVWRARRGG